MLGLLLALASAEAGTMTVHMLDVGQGDALLLELPGGEKVLIDAGVKGAHVVDTLGLLGVQELDLVVTSHAHADHMGGMRDVVMRIPIGTYVDSGVPHTTKTYKELMEAVHARHLTYQPARKGQLFEYEEVTIEVLWPGQSMMSGTRSDLNSNSVVLRVDHGEDCFLFTGDAEAPTEEALLQGGRVGECEVLKVAHHGSHHSNTDSFLRTVDPEIALISCGLGNRYKHPGIETTEALGRLETAIYRTDLTGHITLESSGHGIVVVEGLPADPHIGPVGDDRAALAAIGPSTSRTALGAQPSARPELSRDLDAGVPAQVEVEIEIEIEGEPKDVAEGSDIDLSGVRAGADTPDIQPEPPLGLIARIRAWRARRKVEKETE